VISFKVVSNFECVTGSKESDMQRCAVWGLNRAQAVKQVVLNITQVYTHVIVVLHGWCWYSRQLVGQLLQLLGGVEAARKLVLQDPKVSIDLLLGFISGWQGPVQIKCALDSMGCAMQRCAGWE
jgi:hypothetical protein